MSFQESGPLDTGGFYQEFSDGSGGALRLEYRPDLSVPELQIWGGRPGDLVQLAVLTP